MSTLKPRNKLKSGRRGSNYVNNYGKHVTLPSELYIMLKT
jgi:hypothetical protein